MRKVKKVLLVALIALLFSSVVFATENEFVYKGTASGGIAVDASSSDIVNKTVNYAKVVKYCSLAGIFLSLILAILKHKQPKLVALFIVLMIIFSIIVVCLSSVIANPYGVVINALN